MKVTIKNPSKAYIDADSAFLERMQKDFSYRKTSVQIMLQKHEHKYWLKNSDPDRWEYEKAELLKDLDKNLLFKDKGGYWVRPGLLSYLPFPFTLINEVSYPKFKPIPWAKMPEFEAYLYQSTSMEKMMEARHACVSLPTGCGKSFIAQLIARNTGLDTVVVTPSESIFNELLRGFTELLGKKYVGGYGDGKKEITKKITIAISKSLTNLKEGTPAYDFFASKQQMIVDESHTFAAETLEDVCHGVLADVPYRFFLSATQTRGDGTEKLLNSIIGPCVYEMSIDEAISQGYLCPLNFTILQTFTPSTSSKKDSIENKREHFLYNKEVAKTAALIANSKWTNKQESTLILVEELRQIKLIIDLLNVPYGYVHSGSRKDAAVWGLEPVNSQEQVDRFNKGEIRVLIGTRGIATGTNLYPTHNTINCVGGSSEIITKQGTMGRSTRKLEISKYKHLHKPKPFTMIYDFDITNNPKLKAQLKKRIEWYKEANGTIDTFNLMV
jgi:superfamily II DNA or RNA helicase